VKLDIFSNCNVLLLVIALVVLLEGGEKAERNPVLLEGGHVLNFAEGLLVLLYDVKCFLQQVELGILAGVLTHSVTGCLDLAHHHLFLDITHLLHLLH
jgi:hypothetical protein